MTSMTESSTVGAYEAKTYLPSLLERVASGERITITRHGVPVALLVPADRRCRDRAVVVQDMLAFRRGRHAGGATLSDLLAEMRGQL